MDGLNKGKEMIIFIDRIISRFTYLTWISVGDLCCSSKDTACGDWILLVVVVESIRGVVSHRVWVPALPVGLDGGAVGPSIPTGIVQGNL